MSWESTPISLRGYQVHAHYGTYDARPHGGVAVMVRHDVPCQPITLRTTLQVRAVRVGLRRPYTIASVYLPPDNLDIHELEDLLQQLPQPFLLLGDFNGRHHLWGDAI